VADLITFVNLPSDTKPIITADRALVISFTLDGHDVNWDIETNLALAPEGLADDDQAEVAVITWGRLAKLAEETGEVVAAYIGMTGQNPRKGVTHTEQDVYDELLDVAVTALGAAEHPAGHQGAVLDGLLMKIHLVAQRAREVSGA
jgi:hypothetical protein